MSIHKRLTKSHRTTWVVRWRDPRPREKTFRTKVEAERFEREIRFSIDAGRYRDPNLDRITFAAWARRWWKTAEVGRAPKTVESYEGALRLHILPYIGDARLTALRRIDIQEWLAALADSGLGASGVRTARTVAGIILTSAVHSGVIPSSPLAGLRLPRPRSRSTQALTVPQVETLVAAFDAHYRPLVLVLAYGGLRPGEALALRRRHLTDLGQLVVEEGQTEVGGRLVVAETKTHQSRVVPLGPSVVTALQEHLKTTDSAPDELMFTTPKGARIRLSNFAKVFDRACQGAGLPEWVTPYTLRHTTASLLAQQGVPPSTASAMLGHDPAVYLRTYCHLYPDDLSVAAMALEDARKNAAKRPPAVKNLSAARGSRGDEGVEDKCQPFLRNA